MDGPRDRARPIRLVFVDADPRVRESAAALLASDDEIEVVGRAGRPPEALDVVEAEQPDVVVVDPRLPEADAGIELVATLRRRYPSLGIMVMSWSDELEPVALEAGANCFVAKSHDPSELVEAIVTFGHDCLVLVGPADGRAPSRETRPKAPRASVG